MRSLRACLGMITVTAAAAVLLLSRGMAVRSALDTPVAVSVTRAVNGSIRQTLDLAGSVSYAQQRYAFAEQSGIAGWTTPKREGETVNRHEALVRLDTSLLCRQLTLALTDRPPSDALSAQAAAVMEQLDRSVSQLERAIEQSTVRAYADGQVLQMLIRPGEMVQAGTPVALLSSPVQQITVPVTADQSRQIDPGSPVHIYQDDQKLAEGFVVEVSSPAPGETGTGALSQLIVQPERLKGLTLGDAVEVRIVLREAADVAVVPLSALDDTGHAWQVVDGRAWRLPGDALIWDSRQVLIEGVSEGAAIILDPSGLSSGQCVKEAAP